MTLAFLVKLYLQIGSPKILLLFYWSIVYGLMYRVVQVNAELLCLFYSFLGLRGLILGHFLGPNVHVTHSALEAPESRDHDLTVEAAPTITDGRTCSFSLICYGTLMFQ